MKAWVERYALPLGASLTLLTLLIIALIGYMKEVQFAVEKKISEDIPVLIEIFKEINKTCGIISFEHAVNYIDFLNVISFEGSRIGSMNLRSPEKWKGPYLSDNPTVQAKFYEIVQTQDGYYIIPGTGVQFAQGLRMGKEVVVDKSTHPQQFLAEGAPLTYKGAALAGKIEVLEKSTPSEQPMLSNEPITL
jgi:hypothetical protein